MTDKQFQYEVLGMLSNLKAIGESLMASASNAVSRQQFDDALAASVSTITTAIADLKAKVDAGQVITPLDFSAELATLQGVAQTALAADPGPSTKPTPVTPPVTPVTPVTPPTTTTPPVTTTGSGGGVV